MSDSPNPAARTRRSRRRLVRLLVVAAVLLTVLTIGGRPLGLWSSAPERAKDCVVRPAPAPVSVAPARTRAEPVLASYPGTLEQEGGTVNDASCLNRTQVYGVVRPRSIPEVREALVFADQHDLVVSIAGTQHAMGGQASHPGALVLDMRSFDAVAVDRTRRTATVQAGATWHRVLEAVHPVGLSVSTMPSIDVLSVGGTVSVNAGGVRGVPGD